VLLVYHITVDNALPLLLASAGVAIIVADVRARERNDRQAELQHAAFELGLRVRARQDAVSA
jgi:hypothetical protein